MRSLTASVGRRAFDLLLVVWLVGTLSFVLARLAPGDPITATLSDSRIPAAVRAEWRTLYALDAPLTVQYARYVRQLAQFDLGYSFSQARPVRDALLERLPYSLLLMSSALLLSVLGGALLGTWFAIRSTARVTRWSAATVSALASVPDVWLALVLLALFGAQLGWLPLSGRCAPAQCDSGSWLARAIDTLRHLVLPTATLTVVYLASFARVQRAALREVLHDDVMRTALAKGVPGWPRLLHHAVRRAAVPLLSAVGLALPMLMGGAVFVERVYAWPGMGQLLVNGVAVRDYPLVTAIAAMGGVLVVVGATLSDLASRWLDPRTRRVR